MYSVNTCRVYWVEDFGADSVASGSNTTRTVDQVAKSMKRTYSTSICAPEMVITRETGRAARLFRNGGNQAVRLPKGFEINADEVLIRREGDTIILTPKPRSWNEYFRRAKRMDDAFPDRIEDLPPQARDF